MNKPLQICICGGGGLGHTTAAVFSSQEGITVSLLTGHPEHWNESFRVTDPNGRVFIGKLEQISSEAREVIPNAKLVLLCVPAYLVEQTLISIKPYLRKDTIVGSVVGNTGFFIFAHKVLYSTTPLFAFQRVPYISRVVDYGKEANLLGYKSELLMSVENIDDKEAFAQFISELFLTKTILLDSYLEATLSNSNPILHTGRLYTMWKNWDEKPFADHSLFYHDWTIEASEVEIKMDAEFFELLKKLEVNTKHLKPLLEYYDSWDAESLTTKLKSISSFSTVRSPMIEVEGGWIPDFESRYFTEDFPYGLKLIHDLSHENGVVCPMIDKVYEWGCKMIAKHQEIKLR